MQKRSSIVAACLFLACLSFAQKKDTVRKYLDQNLSLTNKANAFYYAVSIKQDEHYLLYAVYPDSTVMFKAWFKDRDLFIKDGPYEFYFGKRKIAMKGYYANNLQYGPWMFWYPNGILKDSGAMNKGQMVGTWKSWYDNGKLMTVGNYRFDSSNNSYSRANGSSAIVPSSITGLKDGNWKFWYASGTLESDGEFKNDSLVNEWNWYRENGKPSTKEFYRGNKLLKMECFDENGNYSGDFCSILKPPYPIGNFRDFQNYMMDNIQMPKELQKKVLKGSVVIQCTISKEGKLKVVNVTSPYNSLNAEVQKFFNTLTEWSPAITHNRLIDYTIEYKVALGGTGE